MDMGRLSGTQIRRSSLVHIIGPHPLAIRQAPQIVRLLPCWSAHSPVGCATSIARWLETLGGCNGLAHVRATTDPTPSSPAGRVCVVARSGA